MPPVGVVQLWIVRCHYALMKSIVELIADIPTNAVLRLQAQALEKKVVELEEENAALKKVVARFQSEAEARARAQEFVEHRGACFKRRPDGNGYLDTVFCFVCHKPMSSAQGVLSYRCMCGYVADFNGRQLAEVMKCLP